MMRKRVSFSSDKQEKCYLPARFVLIFLLFWAMCLKNAFKASLSVTIVEMVNQTAFSKIIYNETLITDSCPASQNIYEIILEAQGKLLWSPSIQGFILAAYFYGYVITPVFGGRISEKIGGKWPIGLSILISSFLMVVTPASANVNAILLIIVRFVMGLLHGVCFPTVLAMLAQWAPIKERITFISICLVGDQLGNVISMSLAGYLSKYGFAGGWSSVYYVFGTVGCLWSMFWFCLAYNSPSDHPRISKRELDYIEKDNSRMNENQKLPIPWKQILTSLPVWSVIFALISSQWGYTTLLTKLPTYLKLVLHLPIEENGLVNSLVHLCTCVTLLLSGFVSDYLRSKKHLSPTVVRKSFETIGLLGPGLCSVLVPVMGCNSTAIIILLAGVMAFQGFTAGGHSSIATDMAPHHAATLYGFISGIGHTAGVFSPMLAGVFLEENNSGIHQWNLVFYTCAGIYLTGSIIFLAFASAEIQTWAEIPNEIKPKSILHPNHRTSSIVKTNLYKNNTPNYGSMS